MEINIRAAYPTGKMVKLVCLPESGEENDTYWMPLTSLPSGTAPEALRGLRVIDPVIQEVVKGAFVFRHVKAGEFVNKSDKTVFHLEEESAAKPKREGNAAGGGMGYVGISKVTVKEKSWLIEGTHVIGKDKSPKSFYLQASAIPEGVTPEDLKDCIILKPSFEEVPGKTGKSFTVLRSGSIRDKEKNVYPYESQKPAAKPASAQGDAGTSRTRRRG